MKKEKEEEEEGGGEQGGDGEEGKGRVKRLPWAPKPFLQPKLGAWITW